MRRLATIAAALMLSACARSSTMPLSADSFVILNAAAANNVRVVGQTPVQAHTTGTVYGNSMMATTTYSGGQPIVAGTHDEGLVVKMFKNDDPRGANAISARGMLGPKWEEAVKESAATTC